MKSLYALILVLLLSFTPTFAGSETKMFESVVKVHGPVVAGDVNYGSGLCVNKDDDYLYIVTNKHVVGNSKKASVQFYREGHESIELTADVCWSAFRKNQPIDIALLKIDRKKINFDPPVVEFTLDDKIYSEGQAVITIGCPQATWPKASKGHIVKVTGGTYIITPVAEEGQSGSIILNEDGTKAIGLIAWKTDDGFAKAMTLETIKLAVQGKPCDYYLNQKYVTNDTDYISVDQQVGFLNRGGRNQCPPGGCTPQNNGPNQRRLRPNNNQPDTNQPSDGGLKIFPTFPGDQEIPEDAKPEEPPTKTPEPVKVDDSRVVALETKVNDLASKFETANKTNVQEHEKLSRQYTDLDIKVSRIDLAPLSKQIADLKTDLNTALGAKANKDDVVTPGNLEAQLKPITDSVTPGKINEIINPTLTDLKQNFVKVDAFNGLKDQLNSAKIDFGKQITTAITGQNKEVISVFKEFAQAKETAAEPMSNILNSYGTTGLATLIPTLGVMFLGWLYRNKFGNSTTQSTNTVVLAETIASAIKNHLGGVVSQAPFPKTTAVKVTKSEQSTAA